jgi:gluconate 2-dehydrogenase gamma chain
MSEDSISRRNTLKYLGLLTGTEAGRAFLSDWLPGRAAGLEACEQLMHPPMDPPGSAGGVTQSAAYTPQFFELEEFRTVEILTDMIIPTDEKPGAREAQVAHYIDFIVFSAAEFKPELQQEWIEGLQLLDHASRTKHGESFNMLSSAQREALLTEMSLPEQNAQANHPGYSFYRLAKEMTVEGFYSSRVGLMDVLEYKGLTYLSSFPGCTHPEHHKGSG